MSKQIYSKLIDNIEQRLRQSVTCDVIRHSPLTIWIDLNGAAAANVIVAGREVFVYEAGTKKHQENLHISILLQDPNLVTRVVDTVSQIIDAINNEAT